MSDEVPWICPGCTEPVGSERVLRLRADGEQEWWHPGCYHRFEAQP